jgi:hypothetical protein
MSTCMKKQGDFEVVMNAMINQQIRFDTFFMNGVQDMK